MKNIKSELFNTITPKYTTEQVKLCIRAMLKYCTHEDKSRKLINDNNACKFDEFNNYRNNILRRIFLALNDSHIVTVYLEDLENINTLEDYQLEFVHKLMPFIEEVFISNISELLDKDINNKYQKFNFIETRRQYAEFIISTHIYNIYDVLYTHVYNMIEMFVYELGLFGEAVSTKVPQNNQNILNHIKTSVYTMSKIKMNNNPTIHDIEILLDYYDIYQNLHALYYEIVGNDNK